MQAQVEAIADSQRLQRVSSALKLGAFAIPLAILRNVAIAHDLFKAHDNDYLLYRSEFLLVVVIELMAVIFYFRPATLSKRALQVGYAILMARNVYDAAVTNTFSPDEDAVSKMRDEYKMVFTQLTRLWYGLLMQNIQCTVALHLLVVPATIAARALVQEEEKIIQLAVMEVMFGSLVCLACAMVESASRATIIANLRAQSAKALEGAAASMLSSICDAVVHLSASLHIKEPCQRLSILLLKDPSVHWQGKYFGDLFLSEDDVATFKSFIEKAPANDSLACTMHATLRDAHGAPVLVQFFHATCLGLDGNEVHLVGIRDAGGERIGPAPAGAATPEMDLMKQKCDQHMQSQLGTLCTISESSFSSGSTSASAIPMEMSTPWDSSAVKVWVSVQNSSLPILKYTHAFVSMVGASAARLGADLLDIAASTHEQEKLLKTMQNMINELLHQKEETSLNLQMELSTKRLGAIRVDTSVQMDFDSEDALEATLENTETDSDFNVVIHFNSFRALGVKSRHRSRTKRAKKAAPHPLPSSAVNVEAAGP